MKQIVFAAPRNVREGREKKILSLIRHGWKQGDDKRWRHPKRMCSYTTSDAIGLESIVGTYEKERHHKRWKENRKI